MISDNEFHPFFDQENPQQEVVEMIASSDTSQPYEIDEAAVFTCKIGGWLVVEISGCSCWPMYGGTSQEYFPDKASLVRSLSAEESGEHGDTLLNALLTNNFGGWKTRDQVVAEHAAQQQAVQAEGKQLASLTAGQRKQCIKQISNVLGFREEDVERAIKNIVTRHPAEWTDEQWVLILYGSAALGNGFGRKLINLYFE